MNFTTYVKLIKFLKAQTIKFYVKKKQIKLKCPLSTKEIEYVVKNLPTKKTPDLNGLMGEFYLTLKEEIITILCKFFKKIEGDATFRTYFMRPELP